MRGCCGAHRHPVGDERLRGGAARAAAVAERPGAHRRRARARAGLRRSRLGTRRAAGARYARSCGRRPVRRAAGARRATTGNAGSAVARHRSGRHRERAGAVDHPGAARGPHRRLRPGGHRRGDRRAARALPRGPPDAAHSHRGRGRRTDPAAAPVHGRGRVRGGSAGSRRHAGVCTARGRARARSGGHAGAGAASAPVRRARRPERGRAAARAAAADLRGARLDAGQRQLLPCHPHREDHDVA